MANYTRVRFVCRNMNRMERFFVLMVVLRKHNEKRASIIYGVVYPEKEKRRAGLCGNKCIFAIGFYITHFICFSGPVAKSARFLLSLWRNHLHNNFFILKANRPRCEMRPVFFVSLPLQCKSIITKGCSGSRCEIRPGFLVPFRIWPFLGDLRAFRRLGGTSYHPRRKSVLNRKFAENNFFWPKT